MIFERVQVRQVEIDDLLFFGAGGVTGRRRLRRDLRTSGSTALIHGRLLRGGLALGLFVPRFGRLCLIGSGLAILGRTPLAGFANMPCIVRNMTDDEAILAMTDDNLRHRERILPTEKEQSLKMQVEAIKHQGSRPGEVDKDAGKRSTQVVGDRNGMNYKQVQRYIRLTELVPDLQKMVDEKKLAFTPAVEISFIRPKNQRYIAVSIEGQQSSPSLSQAQKMRELDKDGKLNGDVIDGILSQEKKEVDKVIINSAELEKYFGKDKSPREMKDMIISLLDDWKAKQPPELGKPEKKTDLEK